MPTTPGEARPAAKRRQARQGEPAPKAAEIRIRMYRLGVGDCFLLTLPRRDGTRFHMLIDCGIHMSEADGPNRIRAAAKDIVAQIDSTRGERLDVVVGTHEHWDHLSGFHHAAAIFASCKAGKIWCAWTEDQQDAFARSLVHNRDKAVAALWGAMRRLHMADGDGAQAAADDPAWNWQGLLGFFGESPGVGVLAKAAAESMRTLVASEADIVYRRPGEPPFDGVSDMWRIFVLGPPVDKEALKHHAPRAGTGEAYPLAAAELAAASLAAAVGEGDDPPFGVRYRIPEQAARSVPFFQDHYWADDAPDAPSLAQRGEEGEQGWRRIDDSWMNGAEALALQLDKITNNTSLVLALEVGPKAATDNPVILFAADAQVGNWLSWASVEWPDYAGRTVTGPDLLRRTVIYKVGHHASHNATPMEGGLEAMQSLRLALVPTSAEMAGKVKWGTLPWPSLLDRLTVKAKDGVLRSDLGASMNTATASGIRVEEEETHFDIFIPLDLKATP